MLRNDVVTYVLRTPFKLSIESKFEVKHRQRLRSPSSSYAEVWRHSKKKMGCYVNVALNFSSLPLFPFHPGRRSNKTTFAFSTARFKRTLVTIKLSSFTNESTTTQDRHSSHHIGAPCGNSPVLVSLLSNRAHCSRTISGYWVGPDSEDGWGFIQALVDDL